MCEVTEKIERRGEQIGEQRGREAKARDTARNLSQMGMSLEKIAQAAEQKAGDYCMFGHNGCFHLRRSGRNYMGSTQQKTGCG